MSNKRKLRPSAVPPPAVDPPPAGDPPPAVDLPTTTATPLEVMTFACGPVEGVEPQALGLTYWFDAPADGPVTCLTVGFTGRRLGVQGVAGPKDTFAARATVNPVLPGSGRCAVTARVLDLAPGQWQVTAAQVPGPDDRPGQPLPTASAHGSTAYAPIVRVRAPGVRLGAWPAMVTLGTILALVTQAALAAGRGVPVLRLLAVTLLACVVGVVGGKVYYLATHRNETARLLAVGMSVQGFVLASISTLVLGSLATDLPVGTVLDLSTPGLLFGMTIGRFGCFFGGCCAGRPTASRWGLWSSDRRLGVRRIPVQLLESTVAGVLGLIALLLVALVESSTGGLVFVGALAAYTFGRQLLFPLRAEPRKTAHGRLVTMVITAALVLLDVVVAVAA